MSLAVRIILMKKILMGVLTVASLLVFIGSANAHDESVTIYMSEQGYQPADIEVHVGETIVFENVGAKYRWPASNIHPTHRAYPGTDIDNCGTDKEVNMFDACRSIKPGESFEYTFFPAWYLELP